MQLSISDLKIRAPEHYTSTADDKECLTEINADSDLAKVTTNIYDNFVKIRC